MSDIKFQAPNCLSCTACKRVGYLETATAYCTAGKKPRRLPKAGIKRKVADWCPKKISPPRCRIFGFIDEEQENLDFLMHRDSSNIIKKECPITDIEARHATYSALLSKLSLAPDHKENLLNRGLSSDDIKRLEYRTTPVAGMLQIAKQLQTDGLYLAGVPGFYRDDSGSWTFIHEKRGILIPVRDMFGRIQGLQIRRDNVQKRKFRWVSSTEMNDGCKAEGWTHLAGPVRPLLVLTEGPMKADIINALTGLTVLAVPGVNTLTQLEATLTELRSEGLVEVKTAFDMDFASNHHVQNGYNSLLQLLGDMGFRYGTYLWDPAYKGLDDYIWKYLLGEQPSQ